MTPSTTSEAPALTRERTTTAARVRARRNWGFIAAGVGLTMLTTVLFAAAWAGGRASTPVLALAATVTRGQVISDSDLTIAHMSPDPAIATVPAGHVSDVVGKRAVLDLPQGSVLTPESTTADPIPGVGRALVGIRMTPAQMPMTALRSGDSVTVVLAGKDGSAGSGIPDSVPAVVVTTGVAEDGARVVDVTLPAGEAPKVTGWVASGRAAVFLNSEVR